jgi:hypothetical protein
MPQKKEAAHDYSSLKQMLKITETTFTKTEHENIFLLHHLKSTTVDKIQHVLYKYHPKDMKTVRRFI